jgi:hypothetical protein
MAQANRVIGGKKITIALKVLEQKITNAGVLRMGFLESATYPQTAPGAAALHVAQVAFWNEFGTVTAPARPAFRNMVARESKNWGKMLAAAIKATNYDGGKALAMLGQSMRDELESEIAQWPADNAPSTVARKGFNKGLVDTGVLQRSPDYEVVKA